MKSERYYLCAGLVVLCMLGVVSLGYAQLGGGGGGTAGIGAIPGTAFGGAMDPSMVQITDGFKIIPSVRVAERFDSNVFFVPKTPGLDRSDYVTTVAPQLRGLYAGSLVRLNVTGGAVGEYYAKNQGLSYVGANAGVSLDVSPMLDRLWKGTMLTVTDMYMYTPQPPAFLTGDLSGDGVNPYVRGYQTGRVNVRSNTVTANLTVPIDQIFSVTGNFSDGFMNFGASRVEQVGSLLSTTFRSYGGGLTAKVSPQDSLMLNQTNSEFSYGSGGGGAFSTRGGTIGWMHAFTPNVMMTSTGGVQVLRGEFQGRPISATLAPAANFMLAWRDRTTTLMASYNLVIQPTFQFQSQALLVHAGTLTVTQVTPIPQLMAMASLNAGIGDQYGSSSGAPVSYSSYGGTAGFVYQISQKTFLNLNYSYMSFDNKFGGTSFSFDRHVVQFSLSQAFY